jgi:site-specific recombinase XerD
MKNRAASPREDRAASSEVTAAANPHFGRAGGTDLRRAVANWLADGRATWSPRTLKDRCHTMERFCWWLENVEKADATLEALTPAAIRRFLAYAREPRCDGRFGCANRPSASREARPATVNAYYRILRAFTNFCIAEGLLEQSPLKNVKNPRIPEEPIPALEVEQVQALIDAVRRGRAPARDVAILLMLVDSGMRVSELSSLTIGDVDRGTGELTVTGKGNKRRQVFLGMAIRRALWRYLEVDRRTACADEPLFVSVGGQQSGAVLTPRGIHLLLQKAGRAAGLNGGGVRRVADSGLFTNPASWKPR